MGKKKIPDFKSEKEKADWFYAHRDELDDYMTPVKPNPVPLHIRLGLPPRKENPAKPVSIRLSDTTISKAKELAEIYEVPYQTLLKQIIQSGLDQLEKERPA